ncbi:16S rRNA (cytosine(967)-C(5))-methyltransferase RsmB [Pseudoalteromonas peptidolytica]|uniref:16S rRNA (cytosine(967)-C(5))-methyltransferase n=1 Tax=Pseudoalteromonas peptidolytica F12-50-A1 TaxID=1315280 RepID=A0A8I0MRU9_9GAMM|nr:16S rRNA (cytosine(967)-C(5))-methyltransferase RsmB [Pseudoalteromonas peptidolytica]MBE0344571.1 16S rRNA (cytosine967-C5)-methyltransferase [Pseudoalteromonas peptidolytica F12-50-A1]NLR15172.1 16S rRNA (cytosine(967)-C(5))-methyltransferase RsmB [Pseudoalteromonas peptidolytica]GEK10517.1 ribosomal RNA small subunit methyltransferase B [Pseudoalteromonas peptidolytica]
MSNVRALAAQTLFQVVDKGASLSAQLPLATSQLDGKDRALLQQICYGVLRYLPSLEHYCQQLLDQPLKGKRRVFQFLLYVGIYQLQHMRVPAHAAVAETVNALTPLRAPGMKGLVNAILRNFQRHQVELETSATEIPACLYNHPGWFINQLKAAYPTQWQTILEANQQQAPMWLRVNQSQFSTSDYAAMLDQAGVAYQLHGEYPDGILLDSPIDVYALPQFATGACSVQDAAAQKAARLLSPRKGENILDACAAPGGKTCHILELAGAKVTAIDADGARLARVEQNLERIGLSAKCLEGDASDPEAWWDGELYDRILLDVPCSATGVIRRHPDIKWLRRASDIDNLVTLQAQIIDKIWPLLKPGGTLVYATCSVLPQENQQQIARFLSATPDAELVPLHDADTKAQPGLQLLPGLSDGFYYAKLIKK